MNVLVLAPHPDDETLGCGGSLCLHADRGDEVSVVFLTSGELGLKHLSVAQAHSIREQEARDAAAILGVSEPLFLRCRDWMLEEQISEAAGLLAPILDNHRPELIYLPHPNDSHPDHKATVQILRESLERAGFPSPKVRCYEIWTPLTDYTHVQDITPVMQRKLDALSAHESQLPGRGEVLRLGVDRPPAPFDYARAIIGLNQYRGALAAKCDYAEVFMELYVPIV